MDWPFDPGNLGFFDLEEPQVGPEEEDKDLFYEPLPGEEDQ